MQGGEARAGALIRRGWRPDPSCEVSGRLASGRSKNDLLAFGRGREEEGEENEDEEEFPAGVEEEEEGRGGGAGGGRGGRAG